MLNIYLCTFWDADISAWCCNVPASSLSNTTGWLLFVVVRENGGKSTNCSNKEKDKDTSIILVRFPPRVDQSSLFPSPITSIERGLLAGGVEFNIDFLFRYRQTLRKCMSTEVPY